MSYTFQHPSTWNESVFVFLNVNYVNAFSLNVYCLYFLICFKMEMQLPHEEDNLFCSGAIHTTQDKLDFHRSPTILYRCTPPIDYDL